MFTSRGQPVLRCAIYTRQSVARGEQDLTSCDVQRERCEDYVRAMQYEGWVALDERFDDLGVSGGSLERPALRRLLSWCVKGRVDVVVVTSLSEFERDIISERLREAKGRARARGRRAAGRVPLGYVADPNTRQLVIDEDEAALVRAFFERCAAGESGAAIAAWANAAGHRTKVHGGKGGTKWTGRSVLQVVRNPIYLGRRLGRRRRSGTRTRGCCAGCCAAPAAGG